MTNSPATTPSKPHSPSSRSSTEETPAPAHSSRAERVQVRLIRAYFVLGALALTIGIYILLNPELSASGIPLAKSWLLRLQASMETLSEIYFFGLGLVLLLGGTLLLIAGSLVAFALSKQREAWRKAAAPE